MPTKGRKNAPTTPPRRRTSPPRRPTSSPRRDKQGRWRDSQGRYTQAPKKTQGKGKGTGKAPKPTRAPSPKPSAKAPRSKAPQKGRAKGAPARRKRKTRAPARRRDARGRFTTSKRESPTQRRSRRASQRHPSRILDKLIATTNSLLGIEVDLADFESSRDDETVRVYWPKGAPHAHRYTLFHESSAVQWPDYIPVFESCFGELVEWGYRGLAHAQLEIGVLDDEGDVTAQRSATFVLEELPESLSAIRREVERLFKAANARYHDYAIVGVAYRVTA